MYNPADEVSSINFGSIIGGALNAVVNAQRDSAETTVNFVRNVGFMPGKIDAETGNEVGIGDPICVSFSYDKEVSPAQFQTRTNITVKVEDGGKGYDPAKEITLSVDGNEISGANFKCDSDGAITEVILKTVPSGDFIKDGVSLVASQKSGEDDKEPNTSAKLTLSVEESEMPIPALYQKMQIDVPILTMMPIPFIKIDNTDIEFNVKINSVSNSKSYESSNSNMTNNSNAGYKGFGINASTSLNASISNQKSTSTNEQVKKDYSLNIKVHAVQDEMPAGMSRILDILEESIVTKPISSPAKKAEEAV
jgi:hypothetical protein